MALTQLTLTGTKNGVNDLFTLSAVVISGSEQIIFNGSVLKPVGSFSAIPARHMECIINGTSVQLGLPPNANDTLWGLGDLP